MSTQEKSRRSFLIDSVAGLGGVWVAANYPGILAAEEFVLEAIESGQADKFVFFTPEQALEVEEMAAQIIPTDETPEHRIRELDKRLNIVLDDLEEKIVRKTKKCKPYLD